MVIGNDSWKIAGHDIFLDLGSLLCLSAAATNASRCIMHVSGIFSMLTHFPMHFARCITVPFPCHACMGVSGVLRVALLFFCACFCHLLSWWALSVFIYFLVIYTGCSYHGDSLCFCAVGIYE